jgi:hypothetical protein
MKYIPKFQNPYQPMPGRKYIPEVKQYLNAARDKETQAQINKEQIDANNSQNNSNQLTDFGTRLLNGLSTFGGSYIGDAIAGVSPSAANTVSNLTLGLVSQTPKKLLEANRSNNSNKLENRTTQTIEAVKTVAEAELIGAGMEVAAPYVARGLQYIGNKINPTNKFAGKTSEEIIAMLKAELNKEGIISSQKTMNLPWKEPIRKGVEP